MESDFSVPSLEILHLIRESCHDGNFEDLKKYLIENEMGSLYKKMCENGILPDDQNIYDEIIRKNNEKLTKIENKEDDEIKRNIIREKLIHFSKIGDIDSLKELSEKSELNTSIKMDLLLYEIRLALIFNNPAILYEKINKGIVLVEKNCDWDRRNKFKVYQGLYHMLKYEYKQAADLFTSTLATFQCTELFSYEDFIKYTIFCSAISFERKSLDEKILKSTDIIEMREHCNTAYKLIQYIHGCQYFNIFKQCIEFCEENISDIFIGDKMGYFLNEIKIRSYNQLLESYSSIKLKSMAETFCISEDYLEKDLNQFIINERLNCMIDKIDQMVLVRECERSLADKLGDLSYQILNYVEKQANK